jgi:hypothetical protein
LGDQLWPPTSFVVSQRRVCQNPRHGGPFLLLCLLTIYYIGYLDEYLDGGVPVFDCEYALVYAEAAYANAINRGYVPYVTRRSLARLTTTPPPGY